MPQVSESSLHLPLQSSQYQELHCSFSIFFQSPLTPSSQTEQDYTQENKQKCMLIKNNSWGPKYRLQSIYPSDLYLPTNTIILCCCFLFWRCLRANCATCMADVKFDSPPICKPICIYIKHNVNLSTAITKFN